jgi:hypothetical protein
VELLELTQSEEDEAPAKIKANVAVRKLFTNH